MAIQAVAPLRVGQQVALRFELLGPRLRMEGSGRVAWAEQTGQAGVEFLDMPLKPRRLLKEWIFTQFLAMAHHVAWESIFVREASQDARELSFSPQARPPILLAPETARSRPAERTAEPKAEPTKDQTQPRSPWLSAHGSFRTPPWVVDGLILISAVSLFSVISLAMTHATPAWPIALALALGVAGAFGALYALLFAFWIGITPGEHLARQTKGASADEVTSKEEERPRFR